MNIPSRIPGFRILFAIGCASLGIAGCASIPAPTEQMAVSKSAIANAVSAGGSEYAAVEMRAAQDKMDRANRAMEKEDYETARWLAEEAQADARLAEKKAQSAKAQKAALVMSEDIRVLREEISRKSK
jgi:outer membrane murein-binding lipoprotein Lpp